MRAIEFKWRADDIERRLDAGIRNSSKALSPSSKHGTTGHNRDFAIRTITNAYAHAAKVYLNVLVSRPNHELPKIVESVSSTLAALAALPESNLLRNVVWPFCIAGSMARGDQRQAFRDLASAADIHRDASGSSWRGLEVMDRCWRMRDGGRGVDWLDAMDDLGYRVLLV